MNHTFSSPEILQWLDSQNQPEYDNLPFGLVQMSHDGTIKNYNTEESKIAGVLRENAIGKNFFTQVAPCTNNFMVAEKFNTDQLDEEIDYMFTYITQPTKVRLRLIKNTGSEYQYIFVKKR